MFCHYYIIIIFGDSVHNGKKQWDQLQTKDKDKNLITHPKINILENFLHICPIFGSIEQRNGKDIFLAENDIF